MIVFEAKGTNEMGPLVYSELLKYGIQSDSRNGSVLKFDSPVTFVYTRPWLRVNLDPVRDCNPFFHLMEGVMMLGAHNCVECMSKFTGNMAQYSDDGETFNAFYGTRMEDYNQFWCTVTVLNENPNTRQAVIELWRPSDLMNNTKDKACNMSLVFAVRDGMLDMTIYNRSNDLIYGGVTGANIVHFSMIHEAICVETNNKMGYMYHVVNDAHVYLSNPLFHRLSDIGYTPTLEPPMQMSPGVKHDCEMFCKLMHYNGVMRDTFYSGFMNDVVLPVYRLWNNRKETTKDLLDIKDKAWHNACSDWLARRGYDV